MPPSTRGLNACSRQWIGDDQWSQLFRSSAFASLQRLTTSGDEDPKEDLWSSAWVYEVSVKRIIAMLQLIAQAAIPQLVQWRALGSQSNCCLTLSRESPASPEWTLELDHPSAASFQEIIAAPSLPCIVELRLSDLRSNSYFVSLNWPQEFLRIRRAGLRRLILRESCNRWEGAATMQAMQAQMLAATQAQDESNPPLLITGIGQAKPFGAS